MPDANAKRSEGFFEEVYRDLYEANKALLNSDSRNNGDEAWLKKLRIIDSTTISFFSNVLFKGVGRHPKIVKKKGGIKVHSIISANECVPCNVKFTSAATNDSFMLAPTPYSIGELVAFTHDFDMRLGDVVLVYRKRWMIESLFKQIKQNFPLRYFYGESANAIKIQIWVTLITNLLMTLLQRRLERPWSFSGLATMVRIVLMYYINLNTFFESPNEDLKRLLKEMAESPPEEAVFEE